VGADIEKMIAVMMNDPKGIVCQHCGKRFTLRVNENMRLATACERCLETGHADETPWHCPSCVAIMKG
jgi:hypothetical protein